MRLSDVATSGPDAVTTTLNETPTCGIAPDFKSTTGKTEIEGAGIKRLT